MDPRTADKHEIRTWLEAGKRLGATHVITVCDTFDWDDYPVYVMPGQSARDLVSQHEKMEMQQVMECYSLAHDIEAQLKEDVAMHVEEEEMTISNDLGVVPVPSSMLFNKRGVLGDDHSFVRLVDSMPALGGQGPATTRSGDQRIVDAARNSVSGLDVRPTSDDQKLIEYLVKNKHTTPLEFVRFTFHVRLPLFVARQWIRHRTGGFNEESARYGQLRDDFYIPTLERIMSGGQSTSNKQGSGEPISRELAQTIQTTIADGSTTAYREYEYLLRQGLAKELARLVLPVNIYTQWYWTTDLHNLMHFLQLRLHEHAQWEVRQYAKAIEPMASALAPFAMAAWRKYRLEEAK